MRLDLIPERDRFIPGWHGQPDIQRTEFTSPEWQWPSRLRRAVWAFLSSLVQASQGSYQHTPSRGKMKTILRDS
jgi:hypothetical protein